MIDVVGVEVDCMIPPHLCANASDIRVTIAPVSTRAVVGMPLISTSMRGADTSGVATILIVGNTANVPFGLLGGGVLGRGGGFRPRVTVTDGCRCSNAATEALVSESVSLGAEYSVFPVCEL